MHEVNWQIVQFFLKMTKEVEFIHSNYKNCALLAFSKLNQCWHETSPHCSLPPPSPPASTRVASTRVASTCVDAGPICGDGSDAELADARAKAEKRKERARRTREENAAREPLPYTKTLPQVPKDRRRSNREAELVQLVHEAHQSPREKKDRREAFDKKQEKQHQETVARKEAKRANDKKAIESGMAKADAAATHQVPGLPSLNVVIMRAIIRQQQQ